MLDLSLWLVFGCQVTPVFLVWAQQTGGTVCIEMLSGCLYINPLGVNSSIRAPERDRTYNFKGNQTWWRRQTARKSQNSKLDTRCAERLVIRTTGFWGWKIWTSMKGVVCSINLPAFLFVKQVSKPVMEKKRRARINKCLDQLKSLLENFYSSNVSIYRMLL